jgi:hypothetical protein
MSAMRTSDINKHTSALAARMRTMSRCSALGQIDRIRGDTRDAEVSRDDKDATERNLSKQHGAGAKQRHPFDLIVKAHAMRTAHKRPGTAGMAAAAADHDMASPLLTAFSCQAQTRRIASCAFMIPSTPSALPPRFACTADYFAQACSSLVSIMPRSGHDFTGVCCTFGKGGPGWFLLKQMKFMCRPVA